MSGANASPIGRSHQVMSRFVFLACVLMFVAAPAFAQEEAGRGGDMGVQLVPVGPDNVKAIKETLAKAKITLTRDQENALKPIIEETVKAMEELNAQMGAGRGAGRGGGEGRGRGAGGGRGMNPMQIARLGELNDQFEAKMKTVLNPDQVTAWDAHKKEEIKRGGGIEALKVILGDANAPLTAEQEQKIAPLYQELFRAKMMLTRESQGQPEAAKMKQLDLNNATQVLTHLNPAQRKALLDSMKPPAK